MVVGESQILGQVKQSWTVAREVGAVKSTAASSSVLDPLLQRAFSVAKRVRTETQIGSSTVSIASVAAELARKIFGSLSTARPSFSSAPARCPTSPPATSSSRALPCSSSPTAPRHAPRPSPTPFAPPPSPPASSPFAQLHEQSHRADIIITSTGAGHVFSPRKTPAPSFSAVATAPSSSSTSPSPRDVAPDVNEVEGCFVYDIDDLQQVAARNQAVRSREAEAAETIVSREVDRYNDRLAQAPATEAIKQLLLDAESLRLQEVARITQQLSSQPLTADQLASIDRLTKSLTAKLLHPQLDRPPPRPPPATSSEDE